MSYELDLLTKDKVRYLVIDVIIFLIQVESAVIQSHKIRPVGVIESRAVRQPLIRT